MEDNFWVTSSDVDITSPEAQHLVDEALAAAPDEVVSRQFCNISLLDVWAKQ